MGQELDKKLADEDVVRKTRKYHVELVLYEDEDEEDGGIIDVIEDERISEEFADGGAATRFFWDLKDQIHALKWNPMVVSEIREGLLENPPPKPEEGTEG